MPDLQDIRRTPRTVLETAIGWVLPDRGLPFPTVWYREAWLLLWREPGAWVVFTLQFAAVILLFNVLGLIFLVGAGFTLPRLLEALGGLSGLSPVTSLVMSAGMTVALALVVGMFVVPGILQGALPWLLLRRLRHQEPLRLLDLLKASDSGMFTGAIYSLIFGILMFFVTSFGLLYGLLLTVPYTMGLYRMADGETNAFRAFGAGIKVFRAHIWGHLLFSAIALMLQTMSWCTLGLAVLITMPLQMMACALLYLAHKERGTFNSSVEAAP